MMPVPPAVAEPTSIYVDCFGTAKADEGKIADAVRELFPLTPRGIIESLALRAPIYAPTARHGHFGRAAYDGRYINPCNGQSSAKSYKFFGWEKTDKAEALKKAVR
jgi:S-adenosylmethionine synthetase